LISITVPIAAVIAEVNILAITDIRGGTPAITIQGTDTPAN
jgi:hypothetical protein